jgi:RNA polymerase sigma factor for flagellar operon FliA
MVESLNRVSKIIKRFESQYGRRPTEEEISARLNMPVEEFHELVNQVRPVSLLSIDDQPTFSDSDKKSIANLLEGAKSGNPFNQLNLKVVKDVVAKAIEELPERQRLVLSLYYFEDLNLKEIGQVLQVTESRVSQLHAQAVIRLRAKLTATIEAGELEAI